MIHSLLKLWSICPTVTTTPLHHRFSWVALPKSVLWTDLQEVVEHFISKQQFQSWPYSLHGWSSPLSKQEELLGRMRMIYKTTFRWSSLSITTWRSWYHSSWESRFSAMPMALRSSHSHPATLKLLTRQIFNENSLQWSQMLLVL